LNCLFDLQYRLHVGQEAQSGEIIRQWPSIGVSMLCLLSVRVEKLFNDHLSKLLLTHRQCCKSNRNFGAQAISVCLIPLMMNRAGIYSKNGWLLHDCKPLLGRRSSHNAYREDNGLSQGRASDARLAENIYRRRSYSGFLRRIISSSRFHGRTTYRGQGYVGLRDRRYL